MNVTDVIFSSVVGHARCTVWCSLPEAHCTLVVSETHVPPLPQCVPEAQRTPQQLPTPLEFLPHPIAEGHPVFVPSVEQWA
jgi:hypothetical protein